MKVLHLARRFFGSLKPGRPPASEIEWVESTLSSPEFELWQRMSNPDQRHSVQVGRDVEATLGAKGPPEALAAALLHDIGKVQSGLGTYLRVAATLSVAVAGRDAIPLWKKQGGVIRRIGLYCDHPDIGADLLALAGSHDVTVAWAREHHLQADDWTIPQHIAEAIDAADND
jgi:hypothetical protein